MEQPIINDVAHAAYHLPNTGYLILERFDQGIDFILCNHEYVEMDQGYIADTEITIREYAQEIAESNSDILEDELDFETTRDYFIASQYTYPDDEPVNIFQFSEQ